jgi:hypothetical protein
LLKETIDFISGDTKFLDLEIECHFYHFVHNTDVNQRLISLKRIKNLISIDVKSDNWDFKHNIDKAIKDGHPEPEFLKILADVITDKVDIKELDQFEVWKSLD